MNADLPTTAGFAAASAFVRPEDVASSIPCGPDLQAVVDAVKPFWEAGFTDIALVQIGDELQDRFLAEAAQPLLEQLRAAARRAADLRRAEVSGGVGAEGDRPAVPVHRDVLEWHELVRPLPGPQRSGDEPRPLLSLRGVAHLGPEPAAAVEQVCQR